MQSSIPRRSACLSRPRRGSSAAKRQCAAANAVPFGRPPTPAPGGEAPSDITELFGRDFQGPFDGGRNAWPLQVPQACPNMPVILLSWFDGIGTAAHALHTLGARVVHHVAWEVDRECRALLGRHWPQADLRSSFYDDEFEVVVRHVSVGLAKAAAAGGSEPALVLATAGPPCPDFSRTRGAEATGRKGTEGRKFADFLDHHLDPLRAHCEQAGLAFIFLIENAIMNNEDQEHFNDTLRCHSFVCEASDLGPVRRLRLWWTNLEQELHEVPSTKWGAWDPPAEATARSPALGDGGQIRIPPALRPGQSAPGQGLVALPPRHHAGHSHLPHAHHSRAQGRRQARPARRPAPGRRRGPLAGRRSPVRAVALRRPCHHVLLGPPARFGRLGDPSASCTQSAAPLPRRVHCRSER